MECDRAAERRNMPSEADDTPVRHLRAHPEEHPAHKQPITPICCTLNLAVAGRP